MPIFLMLAGIALIVVAYQGTYSKLFAQLTSDFAGGSSGTGGCAESYIYWVAAIGLLGTLGYIPDFQIPSRLLLALIIVALFLDNNGFWAEFTQAIGSPTAPSVTTDPTLQGPIPVQITVTGASNPTGAVTSLGGQGGGTGGSNPGTGTGLSISPNDTSPGGSGGNAA
jgi:hypothetical protein